MCSFHLRLLAGQKAITDGRAGAICGAERLLSVLEISRTQLWSDH